MFFSLLSSCVARCVVYVNNVDQYAYKLTGNTTCAIINITDTVGRMLENNR